MQCSVWNVHSLNNKLSEIMEHVIDFDSDIVFFTETWLKFEKCKLTADFKDFGYKLLHLIRTDSAKSRGGGVGILLKSNLSGKVIPSSEYTSFEHIIVKLPIYACNKDSNFLLLICLYRLQEVSTHVFFEELSDLLSNNTMLSKHFILAGDFNIHIDTTDATTNQFIEIMDMFSLKQHVSGGTHIKGHTLEIIITHDDSKNKVDVQIEELSLSDHYLLNFHYSLYVPRTYTKEISFRPLKNMDSKQFVSDLSSVLQNSPEGADFESTVSWYNSSLNKIMNKHAPFTTKQIKIKPNAPWFDAEYAFLRKKRRAAERRYRSSGLEVHRLEFVRLRKLTTSAAAEKKRLYFSARIEQCSSKSFFSSINLLLDNQEEKVLPTATSDLALANSFMHFFNEKVAKIRNSLNYAAMTLDKQTSIKFTSSLRQFRPATSEEVKSILSDNTIKCSPRDPVPAQILKTHSDIFISIWTHIVNLSLEFSCMDGLKDSIISPLLKDINTKIDTDEFKNYRPINNIVFLSKLIERVVASRVNEHMVANNLYIDNQHGYRKHHSTETLLVKLLDELLIACDKKIPSVLILLDLSAAFDTVDLNKMLYIFKYDIGIDRPALAWFKSFLIGRKQVVMINSSISDSCELHFGVPQGSVLGPILFSIYTRGLYALFDSSNFSIAGFADDNQLARQFLIKMQSEILGNGIVNCMDSILQWMRDHFLSLNPEKTKILIIASPDIQKQITVRGVFYQSMCIRFVESAKNLGVLLDDTLSMDKQICKVVKSCFCVIKKLSDIKKFLSKDKLRTLVSTHILSRLDYCNSLYVGLSSHTVRSLQRVQNSALRLVYKNTIPHFTSLEEHFMDLHWLKINDRIIFKVILLVYNTLHNRGPVVLRSLLQYSNSERAMNLIETRVNGCYGNRAFSHVGPRLWNRLPEHIKNEESLERFKKLLKSYLLTEGGNVLTG